MIEVLHASTNENRLSVEAITVNKLISYYKSILNLSEEIMDDNNINYNSIAKQAIIIYNELC